MLAEKRRRQKSRLQETEYSEWHGSDTIYTKEGLKDSKDKRRSEGMYSPRWPRWCRCHLALSRSHLCSEATEAHVEDSEAWHCGPLRFGHRPLVWYSILTVAVTLGMSSRHLHTWRTMGQATPTLQSHYLTVFRLHASS